MDKKDILLKFISTQGYRKNSPDKKKPINVIPSNRISMREDDGSPLEAGPIFAQDNRGNKKVLLPGGEYQFPGEYVFETPITQDSSQTGWLDEYKSGGYTVRRSSDRKGKTHVVIGPDGTKKYFGDPGMGERSKSKYGKEAFYKRHAQNLKNNPYFRAYAKTTWEEGGEIENEDYENEENENEDYEMVSGIADILQQIRDKKNRKQIAENMIENFEEEDVDYNLQKFMDMAKLKRGGEMIKRADSSYSQRGLWDNIRANKGSGKTPTKEMLAQERKIKRKKYNDGGTFPSFEEKDYENLKRLSEESNIMDFLHNYSKEDVINIFNDIVSNNPKQLDISQNGGPFKINQDLNQAWSEGKGRPKTINPTYAKTAAEAQQRVDAQQKALDNNEILFSKSTLSPTALEQAKLDKKEYEKYKAEGSSHNQALERIESKYKQDEPDMLIEGRGPQHPITKFLEAASNPFTAAREKMRYGRVPDYLNKTTDTEFYNPMNVLDMAYQSTVGAPIAMTSSIVNVIPSLMDGDYVAAGLNALDGIPALPNFSKQVQKNVKKYAPIIPHYLPSIQNGKFRPVEFEHAIRIEPEDFKMFSNYNPNLTDEQNMFHGRWATVGAENIDKIIDYVSGAQSKSDAAKNVFVKKYPKTLLAKTKGTNLPDAAKLMSYGPGEHGDWQKLVDQNLITQKEADILTANVKSPELDEVVAKIRSNPKLIENSEAILPESLTPSFKRKPKLTTDNPQEIIDYLKKLKNKSSGDDFFSRIRKFTHYQDGGTSGSVNDSLITSDELLNNEDLYKERIERCEEGDAGCLEQAQNYYDNYVAKSINAPTSWQIKEKYGISSGKNNPRFKDYGESADSWDIHGLLQEKGAKKIYAAPLKNIRDLADREDKMSPEDQKAYWKSLNLPLGSIIGMGNKGDSGGKYGDASNYNAKKGLIASNHSATVIGYNEEGLPMIYDYGHIVPITERTFNNNYNPVTNITAPKESEQYTYDYLKANNMLTDEFKNLNLKTGKNVKYDEDEYTPFVNTLSKNKQKFANAFGIKNSDYDELARRAAATAIAETSGGDDTAVRMKYGIPIPSYITDKLGFGDTKGITQINGDVIFNSPRLTRQLERLNITSKNYDPWNPEHAAAATMALLNDNKYIQNKNAKTKGNKQDLTDAEKGYYQWSQPGILKKGEAQGESAKLKRFNDAYNNISISQDDKKLDKKQDGGNTILNEIYSAYPAMRKMGAVTLKADPEFTREKTGVGDIEYFAPDKTGRGSVIYENGFEYKHPDSSKSTHGIVYNPENNNTQSIFLDMLHGMKDSDSQYKTLRNTFKKDILTDYKDDFERDFQRYVEENNGSDGDGRAAFIENWTDGKIRNLLFEGSPKDFEKARYSPTERANYLVNPKLNKSFSKLHTYLMTDKVPKEDIYTLPEVEIKPKETVLKTNQNSLKSKVTNDVNNIKNLLSLTM